jgi:phenylacetic acid degradation operon negative regulatory protein
VTASSPALSPILAQLRGEPSRTWSLIVTMFGDALVPRGGAVWLGTLLTFFRALDIGDGVVRTAMSRLASDGWLERNRVGRHSFYRLADKGRDEFREASARIYAPRPPVWAGHFDLVLLSLSADREAARAAFEAAGFGVAAPGVWVAPGGAALGEVEGVLRLQAHGDAGTQRALAARCWPLQATGAAYLRFLAAFGPLREALEGGVAFTDLEAFAARILMIHNYRRIVLRDPGLPAELLPADWPGATARRLCTGVYARVAAASERWLDETAVGEDGAPLLALGDVIARRFKA